LPRARRTMVIAPLAVKLAPRQRWVA